MSNYYSSQSFINVIYGLTTAVENHINGIVFPDETDLTRIEYATNAYAFRKRAEGEEHNNLKLPFLNYFLNDFTFTQQSWWNNELFSRGLYIPELGEKIKLSPVGLKFESTFWCHKNVEKLFAFNQLRFDADSKTTITATVDVNNVELDYPGQLSYTGLEFAPNYNEKDWLERNKITSIGLDFEIITFIMQSDVDISLTEKVIFDFFSRHDVDDTDTTSVSEQYQYIVNRFNESLTEITS